MEKEKNTKGQLKGDIFLLTDSQRSFASSQIELLKAINQCGSISKAAKHIGISYKTAWDRIDAMNNMSSQTLVNRSAGGAQGGGTALTELGQRIIEGFEALQNEHQAFLDQLGDKLHSLNDIANFVKSENMKTSAKNQFRGTINSITMGAVNTEIALDIGTDRHLIAIITHDSVQNLGLKDRSEVIALINASSIIVSTDINIATSARNKFIGKVSCIVLGAVNADITLDIGGGKSMSAMITNTSVTELGLKEGDSACVIFKAPSVTLLKEA
ncbi:hypothetical protein LCGC14_0507710 [marine sediment metagenome]|uniref:Mop domain-containing protein n=1 Tax=marine sediment metagenome TaxID=412755 RepID=A0A0F9SKK2_9ZZZZ|nr:LysR family transcriptional regulator [Methylophaga sp.]HEC59300.1 LysR family transcriptional regulator [Methylophaga sp.]